MVTTSTRVGNHACSYIRINKKNEASKQREWAAAAVKGDGGRHPAVASSGEASIDQSIFAALLFTSSAVVVSGGVQCRGQAAMVTDDSGMQ